MTVKKLREKIAKLPDDMDVIVYWEGGPEHQYFGVDDVSPTKGNPSRTGGKVGFEFTSKGVVEWLFVSVSPESY
jgi:hypothetical protein